MPAKVGGGDKRLAQVASERYADRGDKRRSRKQGSGEHGRGPSGLRTQQLSTLNAGGKELNSADLAGEEAGLRRDRIGAASVQFMVSKDGSNSHDDFGQINLKIANQNDFFVNPDQTHSQPKILHKTGLAGSKRQRSRSRSRSKSQKRSKSRKSIKVGDGNIMCGRCAAHHAPPQPPSKPKRKLRLSSAKPAHGAGGWLDGHYCPVHGYREPPVEPDETNTEFEPTRRVASDYGDGAAHLHKHHASCGAAHSESAQTELVDAASRRIRDSVEFTSMTCTAKRERNEALEEYNDVESEELSEALISELRAIARGHFVLGGDPVQVSTQQSVDSNVKSHRINLLSLGAYTVNEDCEGELDAQSNIATDAQLSQH